MLETVDVVNNHFSPTTFRAYFTSNLLLEVG